MTTRTVTDDDLITAGRLISAAQCLLDCAVNRWGDSSRSRERLDQMRDLLIDAVAALNGLPPVEDSQ